MRAPFSFLKSAGGGGAPVLSSLNYSQGTIAGGGQSIVATGTNCASVTSVTILGASVAPTGTTSTTVTFTLPAHAAGTGTVALVGPGGTSGTLPFEYWTPAQLVASLWNKADYGGVPWAGNASAGASAGRSVSNASTAPSTGTAVGGRIPADLNGTNQDLFYATAADLVSTTAGTLVALFNARTAAAASAFGSPATDSNLFTDGSGDFGLGFDSSGIRGGAFSSGWKDLAIACATGGWHLAQMRWDGSTLAIRLDGGSWSSVACGALSVGSVMFIGRDASGTGPRFDGRLLELLTLQLTETDANLDKCRAYANQLYGVSV